MKRIFFISIVFFVMISQTVLGQIPQTISYQGVLKNSDGTLVSDGNYSLTVELYDVETAGTALWTETHSTVSVSNGIFSVILGSGGTLDLSFDKQYWLGVTVGTGSELSPRIKLTSSPYSLNALSVLGTGNTFPSSGNVGIGTTSPGTKLEVEGASGDAVIVKIDQIGTDNWMGLNLERDDAEKWHIGMNDANDYLRFRRTASSDDMVIDASGNVGIGTTGPGEKLHLYGTGTGGTGNVNLKIDATGGTGQAGIDIIAGSGATNRAARIDFLNAVSSTTTPRWTLLNDYYQNGTNDFSFINDAGSRVITILQNGNVGIGTMSPGNLLHLSADDATASGVTDLLRIEHTTTGTAANGIGAGVSFHVEDGGGSEEQASIDVVLDDVTETTEQATMTFNVNKSGIMSEIMRIDGTAGNVGIGTTAPGAKLEVDGNIIVNGDISRTDNTYLKISNNGTVDRPIVFDIRGTERMRVNSDGNVGIGTTEPLTKLHITYSSINVPTSALQTEGEQFTIEDTDAVMGLYSDQTGGHGSSIALGEISSGALVDKWNIGRLTPSGTPASGIAFSYGTNSDWNANTKVLVINSSGNVGIGTTSPAYALDVVGNGFRWSSGNHSVELGTPWGESGIVINGGETGSYSRLDIKNNPNATLGNRFFSLFYNADGENNGLVIRKGGNVGIGTTSPSYPLHMASGAHVTYGGVWTNASSRDDKEDISQLTLNEALEVLNGLDPVTFKYRVDEDDTFVGFIAEDVPDLVATNDRRGLSAMDIVAVLTKVVQNQQKEIDEQEEDLKKVMKRVALLEARSQF